MKRYNWLAQGILLNSTYRIENVLGEGGYGITYLAFDFLLNKTVAIKEFFPKTFCKRESMSDRMVVGTDNNDLIVRRLKTKFLKEARNIAHLNHPNIIKIHAAFEQNDTAYYVMDLIDGCTLSEMVKLTGPLDESLAIRYTTLIGGALQYLHHNKIAHLDVKPGNIMVRRSDGEPILIDFGLSKQYDEKGLQTSSTPVGVSHGYAPMEQYHTRGLNEFSPETDIYSLAATLYYLLTGAVPPHAEDIFNNGHVFPKSFPERLVPVVSRAMSPRKQDRPHSVEEFLEDLDEASQSDGYFDNDTNEDSQSTILHPIKRKSRLKKYILVISLILGLIIAIIWSGLFFQKSDIPADVKKGSDNESVTRNSDLSKEENGELYSDAEDVRLDNEEYVDSQQSEETQREIEEIEEIEKSDLDREDKPAPELADNEYVPIKSDVPVERSEESSEESRPSVDKIDESEREPVNGNVPTDKSVPTTYCQELVDMANDGNAEAQRRLGFEYRNGQDVEPDIEESIKWYRKAAEQNDAEAQEQLGYFYANGIGVKKNDAEAAKWYEKAAKQGVAGAQFILGSFYFSGTGVRKDSAEGARWYRKAAEQGYAPAQYYLGECYYRGKGVTKDFDKAVYWMERAAEKGDKDAIKFLERVR